MARKGSESESEKRVREEWIGVRGGSQWHLVDVGALLLRVGAPEHEHEWRSCLLDQRANDSVSETLPAPPLVRVRLVRAHTQHAVQQQHACNISNTNRFSLLLKLMYTRRFIQKRLSARFIYRDFTKSAQISIYSFLNSTT